MNRRNGPPDVVTNNTSTVHEQTRLSLDTLLGQIVREQPERRLGFAGVLKELAKGQVARAAKQFVSFLLGEKYAVRGLGYLAENVDTLSQAQQDDMLRRLDEVNPGSPFRRRMIASVARYQLEESRLRRANAQREAMDKEDRAIEFLKQQLRPGDVILASQGGPNESVLLNFIQTFMRRRSHGQREGTPFPGTHGMFYDGSNVVHINMAGKHRASVRDTFKNSKYNAVSVLRLPDVRQAEEFLVRAQSVEQRMQRYNTAGLIGRAVNPTMPTDTGTACICTDYVAQAIDPNDPSLRTPDGIARSERFNLMYSLEFGREPEEA